MKSEGSRGDNDLFLTKVLDKPDLRSEVKSESKSKSRSKCRGRNDFLGYKRVNGRNFVASEHRIDPSSSIIFFWRIDVA